METVFGELKKYLAFFGDNPLIQAFVVVVASLILARVANFALTRLFPRFTSKTKSEIDDLILKLLHRPVFLTVTLLGLLIAFKLVSEQERMERIGSALIVTLIAFTWLVFAVKLTSLLLKWMTRQENRFTFVQPATAPLFDIATKVVVIGGAVYVVLLAWDVDITAWLASAGILGLALGLAAQDTLGNLFAGVSILADAPYKIGDYIVLDNSERGMVTKIGLRSTRILTRDQIEVTIPNSIIAQSKIINESGGPSPKRRLKIPVGVAYGSDAAKVERILLEVAASTDGLASDPPPQVHFVNFGESSLDFELRCFIDHPEQRGRMTSQLNFAIYQALAKAGLEIPFPKRDVYIKELPESWLAAADRSHQRSRERQ